MYNVFDSMPLLWNANTFLNNVAKTLTSWGGVIMVIVGIIMIIVGIWKIASGLMSHGKQQVNWVINILLIVIGALFCFGRVFFKRMASQDNNGFGKGVADELNGLGGNSP